MNKNFRNNVLIAAVYLGTCSTLVTVIGLFQEGMLLDLSILGPLILAGIISLWIIIKDDNEKNKEVDLNPRGKK